MIGKPATLAAALAAIAVSTAPAVAEYTGPRANADLTVRQILDKPKDDQHVILRGRIVKQVSRNRYLFSDGTGEIQVDIGAKRFPAEPVNENTRVEISGEVEKDFRKPVEIDVDKLVLVRD